MCCINTLFISLSLLTLSPATLVKEIKLQPSNKTEDADFGKQVSISNDYLLIGARKAWANGIRSGAAYLFKKNQSGVWKEEQRLLASDTYNKSDQQKLISNNSYFAHSLSILNDDLIIGAPKYDQKIGAVYIYKRNITTNVWTEVQKLQASNKNASDQFGYSVSISNSYLVIGAWGKEEDRGAVYVFQPSANGTWEKDQILQANDRQPDDEFGWSVSIYNDYIVVGATGVNNYSGAIYIFERDNSEWKQIQKLQGDKIKGGQFGDTVSISNGYLVAGAYLEGEDTDEECIGAVYIFKRYDSGEWERLQKLQSNDSCKFGWSVAMLNDYLVVGAPKTNDYAGIAYLYKKDEDVWRKFVTLNASDMQSDDHFGEGVAIDKDTVFIGAHNEDTGGNDVGAVYVYELLESDTNSPTNQPTRLPVQDPHKIYDAKIQITYRLTKLNNPQIDLFEANPLQIISDSIAIIEANYVVENEVLYEDFMIEIQKVNGFNIDNVYLKYGENITMVSHILCKSDIANYLIYKSQNPIFEQHVTDDFKNYFAEQLQLTNKRILLQNDDDNELQFIVFNANKLQIEFNTPCSNDKSIIEFAVFGIVQIAVVIVILWFVIGYLIRFGVEETIMVFSVIACLLLAFMHGSVRSFIMTNIFVANAETILRLRCNELFWYQIYMLQLGEILLFIYLLSKMKSLNVFKIPMYYCLLLLISFTLLFSATMLSWFTIPIIKSGDCNNSELIICIDSKPSDVDIYKEYVAFLSVNICAQCVLCFVFLYKFYQLCAQFGWDGTNKFTYRILSLGIFLVFLNLSEFIYFCITEETFHMIRFTIYSIIIIFSFKICAINEETGNSRWCCWCCMDDDNSIGTKGSLPQIDELNVLKEAESIGLI